MNNPILISPAVPVAGEKLKINYNGFLTTKTDNTIYVHMGYTDNTQTWCDVCNIQMYKNSNDDFEAIVPLKDKSKVNFAFYDATDNWDNNAGNDFSYDIKVRPNW